MATTKKTEQVTIKAPDIRTVVFKIRGTAPLLQAAFSAKAIQAIRAKHEAGSTARGKKVREARDFSADCAAAAHRSTDGWYGVPASAFRCAMISACRLVGYTMTLAKLSFFVHADGFDAVNGQPLVRLDVGEPEETVMAVRNATGVMDLRARPMWREWGLSLRVAYDADQFAANDVANLLLRVGQQVGIGEGRPDSRKSTGMGYGTFELVTEA